MNKKKKRTFKPRRFGNSKMESSTPWLSALPGYLRFPLLGVLIASALSICYVALPALVLLAFAPSAKIEKKEEESISPLSLLGFSLLLCLLAIASGASLLGVVQSGSFCWRPTRYAGIHCSTYSSAPIEFILSILIFWPIFWLCATGIVILVRHIFSVTPSDV